MLDSAAKPTAENDGVAHRVSAVSFEERYAACADPWCFATSPYELRRYDATLHFLSRSRYRAAYEPGCSVGVLTELLASISDGVIATEVAPSAAKRAAERCRNLSNVEVLVENVATFVPGIPLDLVVFSELGYYFPSEELARIGTVLANKLEDRGEFVAVHWLGYSEDHVTHGDVVHRTLLECLPLKWMKGERHEGFRIDSWIKS